MTTALESVRAALIANSSVTTAIGTRLFPKQANQDIPFPYAVLDTEHTKVTNTLTGWAGLDICEVSVEIWANSYTDATAFALTCRRSLEADGFLCTGPTAGVADNSVSPPEFCEGWIFQAFQ